MNHEYGLDLRRNGVAVMLWATAAAALAAPRSGSAASLEQITLEADAQGTVLTLSLSAPVAQHVFRLQNPDRLVIDLPDTRRRAQLPPPPQVGLIAGLRSGVPAGHMLRLVAELRAPGQLQVMRMPRADGYWLRIAMTALRASPPAAMPAAMPDASPVASPAAMPDAAPAAPPTAPPPPASPTTTLTAATPVPKPARSVRAAHAPEGARDIVIAVDAGHGGDDPGATGAYGTQEKAVTLAIARALAARIDREPGLHAVLTRDGDYFVQLGDRMKRADAAHAKMFVSIHADAVRDRGVSGASVYILSERGASSEAAKLLAEHENAADRKGGLALGDLRPDVRSVVLDVAQSTNIGQSVEAADRVLGALDRVGAVRKHEVQQAAFVVLKSAVIPSLLIETAYISNPAEERKLRMPTEQQRLADAIFSGIDSYFRKFPPDGSQYARTRGDGAEDTAELARSGF